MSNLCLHVFVERHLLRMKIDQYLIVIFQDKTSSTRMMGSSFILTQLLRVPRQAVSLPQVSERCTSTILTLLMKQH